MNGVRALFCCFLLTLAARGQLIAALKPQTLNEFETYQASVDREIQQRTAGARPFQWIDENPDRKQQALAGEVVTDALTGPDGRSVSNGLVHDWVGDIYLRGVKLGTVRDFLLDTERHPAVYSDVKQAKVLSRAGNHSVTLLRFVKKKVLTVTLDIEYENEWRAPAPDRWTMSVRSRKVVEVDNGKPLAPDTGHGFLWRMNTVWLLREDSDGTWVELRSVSLSRDTPRMLGWIIRPLIRNFPAEAILSTLEATQKAMR